MDKQKQAKINEILKEVFKQGYFWVKEDTCKVHINKLKQLANLALDAGIKIGYEEAKNKLKATDLMKEAKQELWNDIKNYIIALGTYYSSEENKHLLKKIKQIKKRHNLN